MRAPKTHSHHTTHHIHHKSYQQTANRARPPPASMMPAACCPVVCGSRLLPFWSPSAAALCSALGTGKGTDAFRSFLSHSHSLYLSLYLSLSPISFSHISLKPLKHGMKHHDEFDFHASILYTQAPSEQAADDTIRRCAISGLSLTTFTNGLKILSLRALDGWCGFMFSSCFLNVTPHEGDQNHRNVCEYEHCSMGCE